MKVLVVAANPELDQLWLETELRDISTAFRHGTHTRCFEVDIRHAARWLDIRRGMHDLSPDVVHFAGHGEDGSIVVTDEVDGVAHRVSLAQLARLFEPLRVAPRLLVLNACRTAEGLDQFGTVDHRIGMTGSISDEGAARFARALYESLASRQPVPVAFRAAVEELKVCSPHPGDADYPLLNSRPTASPYLCHNDATDKLVITILALKTKRNVYALLPVKLAEHLCDAFSTVAAIVGVIGTAATVVEQAGDLIPPPFSRQRLRVGQVPLEAGALYAWRSILKDASAISPHAVLAILLVARDQRPTVDELEQAIQTICNLTA